MGRKEGEKRCVSSCEKAAVQLKSDLQAILGAYFTVISPLENCFR